MGAGSSTGGSNTGRNLLILLVVIVVIVVVVIFVILPLLRGNGGGGGGGGGGTACLQADYESKTPKVCDFATGRETLRKKTGLTCLGLDEFPFVTGNCTCDGNCEFKDQCFGNDNVRTYSASVAKPCDTFCINNPKITTNDSKCQATCGTNCTFTSQGCSLTQVGRENVTVTNAPGKTCPTECKVTSRFNAACIAPVCDLDCCAPSEKKFATPTGGRECKVDTNAPACFAPGNFSVLKWHETTNLGTPTLVYLTTLQEATSGTQFPQVLTLVRNNLDFFENGLVRFRPRNANVGPNRWIIDSVNRRIRLFDPPNNKCLKFIDFIAPDLFGVERGGAILVDCDDGDEYTRDPNTARLQMAIPGESPLFVTSVNHPVLTPNLNNMAYLECCKGTRTSNTSTSNRWFTMLVTCPS